MDKQLLKQILSDNQQEVVRQKTARIACFCKIRINKFAVLYKLVFYKIASM
jgi:hypothetical protein